MGRGTILLTPISSADLSTVEMIFDSLTAYSRHVDGIPRRDNAAREFATALPPGHHLRHKHASKASHQGAPVGLLDIIESYPTPKTAFVGLLAVRESAQRVGLGRALYCEAERFARGELGACSLRLAVVEANPVMGFWIKMGFHLTGEVKPFKGKTTRSRAVFIEKEL